MDIYQGANVVSTLIIPLSFFPVTGLIMSQTVVYVFILLYKYSVRWVFRIWADLHTALFSAIGHFSFVRFFFYTRIETKVVFIS